jgi:hypothetical protein
MKNFTKIDQIISYNRKIITKLPKILTKTINLKEYKEVLNKPDAIVALPGDYLNEGENEEKYNRIEIFKSLYNIRSNL